MAMVITEKFPFNDITIRGRLGGDTGQDRTGVKPLHLLHTYNCDSAATVSRTMSSIMLMLIIQMFNSR